MMKRNLGEPFTNEMVSKYFKRLVDNFFKMLPMKEKNEKSLPLYMENLKSELLSDKELIVYLNDRPEFISLLAKLQYLITLESNPEDFNFKVFRSNVFNAISICNSISELFNNNDLKGE